MPTDRPSVRGFRPAAVGVDWQPVPQPPGPAWADPSFTTSPFYRSPGPATPTTGADPADGPGAELGRVDRQDQRTRRSRCCRLYSSPQPSPPNDPQGACSRRSKTTAAAIYATAAAAAAMGEKRSEALGSGFGHGSVCRPASVSLSTGSTDTAPLAPAGGGGHGDTQPTGQIETKDLSPFCFPSF